MSCTDCENEQNTKEKEYYIRIDTANILIYGCEKHVKILIQRLRNNQLK